MGKIMSPLSIWIFVYFIHIITSNGEYPSNNISTPKYIHITEYKLSNNSAWIKHRTKSDTITSCSAYIPSLCIQQTNTTLILSYATKTYDFSANIHWNYTNAITSHSSTYNQKHDSRRRLRRRRRRKRCRRRRRCRHRRCGGGCGSMGMRSSMGMMGGMMPGMGSMGGMMPGMGSMSGMGGMMPGMGSMGGMMPGMGSMGGMHGMSGMGMHSMGGMSGMHHAMSGMGMNPMQNMNNMGMNHGMNGMMAQTIHDMHGGHPFVPPKVEVNVIHEKKKDDGIHEKKEESKDRRRLIEIYKERNEEDVYYEYRMEKCVCDDGISICLVWDPWNNMLSVRYIEGNMMFVEGNLQSNEWMVSDVDVEDDDVYECDRDLFVVQYMEYEEVCIAKREENDDLSILMRSKVEDDLKFGLLDKLQWDRIYFVNEDEKKLCRYLNGRSKGMLCVELQVDMNTNNIRKITKVSISQYIAMD